MLGLAARGRPVEQERFDDAAPGSSRGLCLPRSKAQKHRAFGDCFLAANLVFEIGRSTDGHLLVRAVIVLFVVALFPPLAWAGQQDATARQLLASWKDEDPSIRAVAQVVAAAFASGLAWSGTLGAELAGCCHGNREPD